MRNSVWHQIDDIYCDPKKHTLQALDEIFNIVTNEYLRGFEVGDSDGIGNVILSVVPDLDSIALNEKQKVNLALAFNNNDGCREIVYNAVDTLVDMGEHE